MKKWILLFRFEFLLFSLLMFIFNKIFFFSVIFYTTYVWSVNMLLLGLVSMGIFHEREGVLKWLKNVLFTIVAIVPLFYSFVFSNPYLRFIALATYLCFYFIIFTEVMRQIIKHTEVTESIIMGSLSGFLLIIIIATFSFLLIDFIDSNSFNNISGNSIPERYHQFTYFSTITLTTIGYGDIAPVTDNARLLAAFWGVIGQFYMVAVVGIIISKFTSK